jgi:membrane fusion protein (multidrug efflux system)
MNVFGSQRWKFPVLLACLVMLLAACGDQGGSSSAGAVPVLEVVVTRAEKHDIPLTIEMVGTTLGAQDVPIRARVEGFLESMEFQEGTFVQKDDVLYTIDPQPFQAKLVEAQSQLAAAQTHLAKADADLARIQPLAEMMAVSQQDLDGAIAQEAAARASVQASEAAVDLAEIELSYTRIFAPIDGLIGISEARPGEFVGRDPNPVVLNTLSDIDPIRVRFAISEREYLIMARTYMERHKLGPEEKGRNRSARKDDLRLILADGSEHDQLGGVVAASQSINVETGTYTLEAAFPNPTNLILPGQFARVRALYEVLEDAVVVPRQALVEIQGLFRVYVVNDQGEVEAREIQKGPDTENDVVIETGLKGGERVIVEGLQRVRPGMSVTVRDWTDPMSKQQNG